MVAIPIDPLAVRLPIGWNRKRFQPIGNALVQRRFCRHFPSG
jgi:hypothetical protein